MVVRHILKAGSYTKRALFGPRQAFFRDMDSLAQHVLSPTTHMWLKRKVRGIAVRDGALRLWRKKPVMRLTRDSTLPGPVFFRGDRFDSLTALLAAHGSLKTDIVVVSAFLGRYEVLDLMVSEATSVPENYDTMVCLVGSGPEDEAFLKDLCGRNPSVIGTVCPNNPVGGKWQYAVDLARIVADFELLAITGSDDILPVGLLSNVIDKHRLSLGHASTAPHATALYATMEWLILSESPKDKISPQLVKCSYKLGTAIIPLGAGRFYARHCMDHLDGDIFDTTKKRLLDDKGFYQVRDAGFGVEYLGVAQGAVLSLKGDWPQMNGFDVILKANSLIVDDFSFQGYDLLQSQLTSDTFAKLFKA